VSGIRVNGNVGRTDRGCNRTGIAIPLEREGRATFENMQPVGGDLQHAMSFDPLT
jgi:hypothetical protein